MRFNRVTAAVAMSAGLFLTLAPRASAVVIVDSPVRNTDPDPASIAFPAWQYQGTFGEFTGTPIAPDFFITAKHIGGSASGSLVFHGISYPIDSTYNGGTGYADDPASDLRIWKIDASVNGAFATFAPLYTASDEVGKHLVVFGMGGPRGSDVTVNAQLKGWTWQDPDGVGSWGENDVSAIVDLGDRGLALAFTFDRTGSPNEAALTGGDSGGGLFILQNGAWHLAGINSSADGPFKVTLDDPPFDAALVDKGGLFEFNDVTMNYDFNTEQDADIPGTSYATRISARLDFIDSVVPEPATAFLLLPGAVLAMRRRR